MKGRPRTPIRGRNPRKLNPMLPGTPDERAYRPANRGGRFSVNARTPSRASSVSNSASPIESPTPTRLGSDILRRQPYCPPLPNPTDNGAFSASSLATPAT